ncbi:MAG: S41 family peptidase [Fibrobacter sp.]|nr:S41 family peptidase [Fibrobacter sp.]
MTSKFSKKTALTAAMFFVAFLLFGCSDFFHPVESTPTPTEYQYNYWLLKRTYLYESDLDTLDADGDKVENLYKALSDPYTRYVPPSKSEQTSISMNTSIVQGDVGMEYLLDASTATLSANGNHPLFIYRVYEKSPAAEAGFPRYGNIIEVNGVDLVLSPDDPTGYSVYNTYDSVLTYNKEIAYTIVFAQDTIRDTLTKTDIYAPTVFLDTVDGITVISITGFKQTTINQTSGSLGELKAYLDSTRAETNVRILNLMNNPGGHVNQCIPMADLFVSSGVLSSRYWKAFDASGKSLTLSRTIYAQNGDAGENRKFVLLVNESSASCAEIFAASVSEGANIPVIGKTSFGKGIGQTTWTTIENGMAIITNLEFLTPKGNSYHRKGIVPDYVCEGKASVSCAVTLIKNNFDKATALKKRAPKLDEFVALKRGVSSFGGAFIEEK